MPRSVHGVFLSYLLLGRRGCRGIVVVVAVWDGAEGNQREVLVQK